MKLSQAEKSDISGKQIITAQELRKYRKYQEFQLNIDPESELREVTLKRITNNHTQISGS